MEQYVKYLWLILGWAAYFSFHSILASKKVKTALVSKGIFQKKQRIIYNTVSAFGLLTLLFLNGTIQSALIFHKTHLSHVLALFIAAAGVLIINAAFKQYNFKSFIGFAEEKGNELERQGILNYTRHPIYLGTILLVIGFVLYDPRYASLVSAVCIFIYLPIGIHYEEKKLISEFGKIYLKYKKEVPALFPDIKVLLKKIT